MKTALTFLLILTSPMYASHLGLGWVKQVVYLHDSDTEVKMEIIDVPFVSAYAAPEWVFNAISEPFIPPTDGSWRDPSDVNLATLYGIVVSGTYKKNSKDVVAIIDLTKAKVPAGYPFTLEQVTEQVKKCVELVYPYNPEFDNKLEIKIIRAKNGG